ncbi:unnamed protein product (macronuclear) [Paramecium tetraurelia]|uniref:Uncharacterized protein n=1 Tax=Paramecium tetraurelia TaxID=5888 RepID=A0BGI2_PARTE|nr:uncharacterized protein GSPATT00028684001 [Paramecium tetraurelia]CAK57649.1 unnamed protein product [Paramecium tetraurelia]|eukprot:XP_001425047.1 hypothetical protein (macronuclear) [Paramecium tetraurelia strain d4-2]
MNNIPLQTHPNVVLISEDIKERGLALEDVVFEIADVFVLRKNKELVLYQPILDNSSSQLQNWISILELINKKYQII